MGYTVTVTVDGRRVKSGSADWDSEYVLRALGFRTQGRLREDSCSHSMDVQLIERTTLRQRLDGLGGDRIGNVVLDLTATDLAAWLADPAAR